jgi:hypothetical protein
MCMRRGLQRGNMAQIPRGARLQCHCVGQQQSLFNKKKLILVPRAIRLGLGEEPGTEQSKDGNLRHMPSFRLSRCLGSSALYSHYRVAILRQRSCRGSAGSTTLIWNAWSSTRVVDSRQVQMLVLWLHAVSVMAARSEAVPLASDDFEEGG